METLEPCGTNEVTVSVDGILTGDELTGRGTPGVVLPDIGILTLLTTGDNV